ncbi:precorrin-6Y C5,15-methyltransferase {decarboxylating} [Geoglobus ahangari]|uniref:Precorrin-6Y C5,15-methyltransferase (decarboxylating) n=1 Tax=Geoglobus ahangari TaxID=113653 RepID=A0A0F7IF68_9EURY|nr:precorrin-6y C5,15-methyltransferase (decarboxylating) subunit CbiE [Geoglobus ahangari]AKG91080.1 precorrin-6Y C5,15-methyltransferase {decarboxylating} [Geoglobus ahangari]
MLWVVGVGLREEHITEEGKKAISRADVVYGSRRAVEVAKRFIRGDIRVMERFGEEVYRKIEEEGRESEIAVLSTGDPMIAGMGRFFRNARIVPGISSVQIALSRLGVDLCDVVVVNAHSRNDVKAVPGRNLLILARKGVRVEFPGKRIVVLERLCSEDERVFEVDGNFLVEDDYTIVFVEVVE